MDQIDNQLSEIRKMNVQQSDLTEKAKDGLKEREEMMLRKEDRRKEKEFMDEAEHELQERGGGGGGGGGGRRENYGFWQKGDNSARNEGGKFAKNGRLSRKEHFVRERHNQNIHSRLGPWMEKSSSSRHHPYKRFDAKMKASEGRIGNSNKKQSFIVVDQVGMLD